MSQNKLLKYVAVPGKTIMIFMMLFAATVFLQVATPEIINELFLGEEEMQSSAPEEEHVVTRQERIDRSKKEFMPDGTIHLVYDVPPSKDDQRRGPFFSEERKRTVKVYDANDTLIWSGDYPNYSFPLFRASFMRLGTVEIYDTNDKLLWSGDKGDCPYVYLPESLYSGGLDLVREGYIDRDDFFEFSKALIIPVISTDRKIVERWRYDPRHRYFIGFDFNDRGIGFAGKNGVKKTRKEIEPFEEFRCMTAWCSKYSDSPIVLWQTVHTLHQISFEKEIFELLYEVPDTRFKSSFLLNNWRGFERNYETKFWNEQRREYYRNIYESRPAITFSTEDGGRYLLLRDPVERIKLDLPDELAMGWNRIIIHKDGIFLRHGGPSKKPDPTKFKVCENCGTYHSYDPPERKVELYAVNGEGQLTLINRFEWTRPEKEKTGITTFGESEVYWHHGMGDYITIVSPSLFDFLWHLHYQKYDSRQYQLPHLNEGIFQLLYDFQPTSEKFHIPLALFFIVVALLHAWPRRTGKGRLIFWLVVVALFNLAGFLTYLALNHTTVIRCAACGKKRGLERSDCPSCGALLPVPERRETDLILV
jgi:hypothetical protein